MEWLIIGCGVALYLGFLYAIMRATDIQTQVFVLVMWAVLGLMVFVPIIRHLT